MSVFFTWVSSLMDADSVSADQLEKTLTDEGTDSPYFGWQKLTRQVHFDGVKDVDQVYFAGYEKSTLNFPEQLYSAYLKAYDSEAAISWFSDEGDKGIFPNQYKTQSENK